MKKIISPRYPVVRSFLARVSPSESIPQDSQSVVASDYRTVPATLNDDSYIANMLSHLKHKNLVGSISEDDAFMKMGMLLHTFADTHSHQLFTGYINTCNSVKLTQATNNITGEDVTEQCRYSVEKYITEIESILKIDMPALGHMTMGHIPDLTHLSFSMQYKGINQNQCIHTRSNTAVLVEVCQQI